MWSLPPLRVLSVREFIANGVGVPFINSRASSPPSSYTKKNPTIEAHTLQPAGSFIPHPLLQLLQADRGHYWIGMMLGIVAYLCLAQVRRAINKCNMSECLWIIP
jgi:hypothetical protein